MAQSSATVTPSPRRFEINSCPYWRQRPFVSLQRDNVVSPLSDSFIWKARSPSALPNALTASQRAAMEVPSPGGAGGPAASPPPCEEGPGGRRQIKGLQEGDSPSLRPGQLQGWVMQRQVTRSALPETIANIPNISNTRAGGGRGEDRRPPSAPYQSRLLSHPLQNKTWAT